MLKISSNLSDKFKVTSVRKNALIIGSLFTLSRIIGTLRESVISRFVTRDIYDMYTLAVKIPSMIRRLSSEGTLENAYVPSLNQFPPKEQIEASKWLSRVATVILIFSSIVVYAFLMSVEIWSPALLKKKYTIENLLIFKNLFTIILPIILLYFLSSTFIAVLHKHEKFVHANFGQSIANIFMVTTAYFGYLLTDSYLVLALSTLAGATMHLVWQYYGVCKLNQENSKSVNLGFTKIVVLSIIALILSLIGLVIGTKWMNLIHSRIPALGVFEAYKPLIVHIICYTILAGILFLIINLVRGSTLQMMPSKQGLQYGKLDFGPPVKMNHNLLGGVLNGFGQYLLPILAFSSIFLNYKLLIWSLLMIYIIRILSIKEFKNYLPLFKYIDRYGYLCISPVAFVWPQLFILLHLINKFMYLCNYQLVVQDMNPRVNEVNQRFLGTARNAFFGTGVNQIISSVSIAVSAKLGDGAPSLMNRADKIMQFPIGILGVSFGVALLPRITNLIVEGKLSDANKLYRSVFITNMSLCILVIVLSFFIVEPLANFFYLGGKTSPSDVKVICTLFKIQILGLPSSVILKTLYPIYFGLNRSEIITRVALIQCSIDVCLKLTLLKLGFGIEWMALSWVIGSWASAIYLFWYKINKM